MKKVILVMLLVLLFLTSFSGMVSNKDDKNDLNEYFINYRENTFFINETGYTREGYSTIIEENVIIANITNISFELSWIDTHSWPPNEDTRILVPYVEIADEFSLFIKEPNGTNVSLSTQSPWENISYDGLIDTTVKVNDMINSQIVYAESKQDAFNQMAVSNGIGEWIINITCIDAPGTGPGGFMGPQYDMGNDWELNITIFFYEGYIDQ